MDNINSRSHEGFVIELHYCKRLNKPIGEVKAVENPEVKRTHQYYPGDGIECNNDCNSCHDCEVVPITIGPVDDNYMEAEAKNREKMGIKDPVEGHWRRVVIDDKISLMMREKKISLPPGRSSNFAIGYDPGGSSIAIIDTETGKVDLGKIPENRDIAHEVEKIIANSNYGCMPCIDPEFVKEQIAKIRAHNAEITVNTKLDEKSKVVGCSTKVLEESIKNDKILLDVLDAAQRKPGFENTGFDLTALNKIMDSEDTSLNLGIHGSPRTKKTVIDYKTGRTSKDKPE